MDRDSRNILFLLIAVTAFKGLFAAPLYLLDDEAYYWVWSRNLSLSYFDHPPLIAVLIRLSTMFFGESIFGIRALGAILSSASIWLGLDLVYRIFENRKILWNAVIVFLLALPFFAAGTIMTPDTPMLFFIALGLWSFYRAAFEMERNYWWLTGAAFGLALLSKYTAVLWLGSLLVAMVSDTRLRRQLRDIMPWLAGVLALLIFMPVVIWNYSHDWVSFKFQLSHGLEQKSFRPLFYLGEFFGGQAGLISPGIFLLILAIWIRMTGTWEKLSSSERFLLITGFLPFLFFVYTGTRARVEANWPALCYFTGIILIARWHGKADGWRRWVKTINIGLMVIFLLIIIVQAHFKLLPLTGKQDPTNRYYGWPGVLDQIEKIWRDYPEAMPVGNKYQIQSQLAYRFKTAGVPALNISDRPNHFDYIDDTMLVGNDLLIVSAEPQPRPGKFTGKFDTVEYISTIKGFRKAEKVRQVQVYIGRNYKGRGS